MKIDWQKHITRLHNFQFLGLILQFFALLPNSSMVFSTGGKQIHVGGH